MVLRETGEPSDLGATQPERRRRYEQIHRGRFRGRVAEVFVIRPDHNPVGPFDFGRVYDEASDRERPAHDLISQGYEDAYQQLVEPLVAAVEDDVEA